MASTQYSSFKQLNLNNRLQGSAMLLALFVIIVVMLIGTSLMKVLSTSSENIAQEVLGTRALFAANSGMQAHLQQLFPLAPASGTCIASQTYLLTNIDGLKNCQAVVSCNLYATVNTENYYRLTSTGKCGNGTIASTDYNKVISERTVVVEAKDIN